MRAGEKYRAFISYSHSDRGIAEQVARILEKNGIDPLWDKNFLFGTGFHDQIRTYIAHAHVFIPLLTPEANERKWVHQEIGYSMALHVPVLPIAIGTLPDAMIHQIHALQVPKTDIHLLDSVLDLRTIERVILRNTDSLSPLFSCAQLPDDRAKMMAVHASDVLSMGKCGVVRQKGGLSSFNIPLETVGHSVWSARYGKIPRSEEHFSCQRNERLELNKHAEQAGCILMINPKLSYAEYGVGARICRLNCVLSFLKSMPDDRCWVAFKDMEHAESVTIVGNWFAAESVSAEVGKGYRQTIFTRHAPTVMARAAQFDEEFDELLALRKVKPLESRRWAIEQITGILKKLKVT